MHALRTSVITSFTIILTETTTTTVKATTKPTTTLLTTTPPTAKTTVLEVKATTKPGAPTGMHSLRSSLLGHFDSMLTVANINTAFTPYSGLSMHHGCIHNQYTLQ